MKNIKLFALLLALVIAVACLVACNSDKSGTPDSNETEKNGNGTANNDGTNSGIDATDGGATEGDGSEDATVDVPSFEETGKLAIFANGEYHLQVIRSEYANSTDKAAYQKLRDLLKRKTDISPSLETDFVAANETRYEGPAILVGQTDYEESKELHASIRNNQYAAKLMGNKYVICFKNVDGYEEVLSKIKAKLNSCKDPVIAIDESWNIEGTLDNISFVPDIEGGWDESFDGGQGSTYCLKENCSSELYDEYVKILADNGFKYHSSKRIADCAFDLMYSEDTIAYVMYFSDTRMIKISMDKRSTFALPTLEEDNVYDIVNEPTITQVGLGDSLDNGMLYISKMSDGSFIIIDGGISATYIYDSLVKLSGQTEGIRIAAWLITHHHNDHAEGFLKTSQQHAKKLIVEKIIHCQPRPEQLRPGEGSDYESVKNRIVDGVKNFKATNPALEQIKAHPGMEIYIRDAKFTVLATIDTIEPRIISNVNNASMVFRMEVGDKSIIFLGDSEPMQTKAMYAQYGEENFRCDALQLAHHGYGNTNTGNDSHVINVASQATVVFCPVSTHDLTSEDANVMGMKQNALFFYNDEVTVHVGGEDNVTLDLYTLEQIGERWEPRG